ncbi:probable pectinesterase 29 [Cornus florida]|uniref:probable pectinesterase 29 n=1 Tax=Cornus florida TaxID=4283 RepID=UPI0028A04192|nr:probable pectinesterase 29 [Cornus florida]
MAFTLLHHILCIALFFGFGLANAQFHRKFGSINPSTLPTIYVDASGYGNFKTIQSAIDSIPSNNSEWICIYIKAGEYREQVTIPKDKPFIYLKGEGKRKTSVVWDAHGSITTSATFTSEADNIVAKSITFRNSYNNPPTSNNQVLVAVAAWILGDKSAFYRCGFLGFQDTLWDHQGRHYFKLCTIEGSVDFIFGAGQSIYERSSLSVISRSENGGIGVITAQGRASKDEPSGFIFKNCNVFGSIQTYLGRPWRDYARVVFYNSTFSDIVAPEGWDIWNSGGRENQIMFAEHGSKGLGSNNTGRVAWEMKLDQKTLSTLTSMKFIDNEGWMSAQPFNMLA